MRNGKIISAREDFRGLRLCLFLLLASPLVFGPGCRSYRSVAESASVEESVTVSTSAGRDSLDATAATREDRRESSEFREDENTVVRILRDSCGRVSEIRKSSRKTGKGVSESSGEKTTDLRAVGSSTGTETSGSVATVRKKKKETKTETKGGVSLECRIGWGLVGMMIILFLGDWIWRKLKTGTR